MPEKKEAPITPQKYGEGYRNDFINMYHEYAATAGDPAATGDEAR